jgi:dTDP-4-amino-4,6-dideoxygalactose transaminase
LKTKLDKAARLARGQYTPFLVPFWDKAERDAVDAWLDGRSDPGADQELRDALQRRMGPGWFVRTTASGRTALQVALEALKLPDQAHVILPSYACMGVVAPVIHAGLRPLLVDIDPDLCISSESVKEAGERPVGAVIIPHLGGQRTAGTDAIVQWGREMGVPVIDDAAQNFGLEGAGEAGDVAIFSSGGGKPLFGPGGGWIATRRSDLAERISGRSLTAESRTSAIRRIRAFVREFVTPVPVRARRELGALVAHRFQRSQTPPEDRQPLAPHFPLHSMSDIEARLALLQLGKLDEIVVRRRENAGRWRTALERVQTSIRLAPAEPSIHTKMWISTEGDAVELEDLRSHFAQHGIETELLYTPLHMRPGFHDIDKVAMPTTERLWSGICSLPARPNLDEADWERISRSVETLEPRGGDG